MSTVDIINTTGVSLILLAFLLLSIKKVSQDSVMYNLLNVIGAGTACIGAYLIAAWPFVVLEGIWALVAVYSLGKIYLK